MKKLPRYEQLSWRHDFWSLLRYYRSLRLSRSKQESWLADLTASSCLPNQASRFPIKPELIDCLNDYLSNSVKLLETALAALRSEKEANAFCQNRNFLVGSTFTKNQSHHQSSKALIAAVSGIAEEICRSAETTVNLDPQRRAVWLLGSALHASARNLDGAMPSLENPSAIWEIKEYWGKTKGGSKMSDAVYECLLVGLELRTFEAKSGLLVAHIVFVDGKDQWAHRKSDLVRFIDLHQQGLIDHLIVGREVETVWPQLCKTLADAVSRSPA